MVLTILKENRIKLEMFPRHVLLIACSVPLPGVPFPLYNAPCLLGNFLSP